MLLSLVVPFYEENHFNWNISVEDYKIFRWNKQSRRSERVALYVKKWVDCVSASENLLVALRACALKSRTTPIKGICWSGTATGHLINGSLWMRLLSSATRGIMLTGSHPIGDFEHPNVCWENNMEGFKQSWRFLKSVEDNFLVQVLCKPTRARPGAWQCRGD